MRVLLPLLLSLTLGATVSTPASSIQNEEKEPTIVEVTVSSTGATDIDAVDVPSSWPQGDKLDAVVNVPSKAEEPIAGPASEQNPSSVENGPTSGIASLVVLQRELEAVQAMINLQQLKMTTLEKVRTSLLANSDNEEPALGLRTRQGGRRATESEIADVLDRRLAAMTADAAQDTSSMRFDSYFIEKANTKLPSDVVGVKMDKISTLPTHELTVVAMKSGIVRIYITPFDELLSIDTGMAKLQGIQLDLASDPPLLAVFANGAASQVRVFALHFQKSTTQKRPTLETSGPASATEAKTRQSKMPQFSLTATELFRVVAPQNLHGAATGIVFARSARRSVVSIAHFDGTLQFYALNGTLLHDIPTETTNLSVLATHRHLFAFANSSSTVLFRLSRQQQPAFQICSGSLAQVTSIAFDSNHPDIVYTGTSNGELLVFATSGTSNPVSASESGSSCRLVHRSIVARGQPLQILVVKSGILAASSTQLAVFNSTRSNGGSVTLTRVCTTSLGSYAGRSSIATITAAENTHATTIGLVTVDDATASTSLLVLQSLLPSESMAADTSGMWRTFTFLGMIAIVVVTAQFFLRRNNNTGTSDPTFPSEGEKWRQVLEQRQSQNQSRASAHVSGSRDFAASKGPHPPFDRAKPAPPSDQQHQQPAQPYMGDPTMFGATIEAFQRDHQKRLDRDDAMKDSEFRKTLQQARRETLECSFDDDFEGEEEEEEEKY